MKRPVLHQLAIFIIAAGTFFTSASFAQANTFTVPQIYHYSGLTFTVPLTYTKPLSFKESLTTILFTSQNKLTINKDDTLKPLYSIILTPPVTASVTPTDDP